MNFMLLQLLCAAQREDPIVRHVCVYQIYFLCLFANRMKHLCSISHVHQLNLCMDLAGIFLKLFHSFGNHLSDIIRKDIRGTTCVLHCFSIRGHEKLNTFLL